ncbi:MAG: DNA polymerase III subunit alpha [Spirochaetales bacterium]|nr:MAG: DNA polymerase III subunit alpha [Spirochaetales bacterium]
MKTAQFAYHPIHCRSYFSLLKGCVSPEELCASAAEKGYRILGMADWNNFYGLIRFIAAAERYGIKPVSGVVIAPAGDPLCTLYWKGRKGFARINRILVRVLADEYRRRKLAQAGKTAGSNPEGEAWYDPVEDLVREGWEDVSVLSHRQEVLERLSGRGRDLYAALPWGRPFSGMVRWARERKLPLVAVNDAVYHSPEDGKLYRLLRAIDLNTTVEAVTKKEEMLRCDAFTAGGEDMERFFSSVPDALYHAEVLAESLDARRIRRSSYVFPAFGGLTEEEAFAQLKSLCFRGILRRYGKGRKDVIDRLFYELGIIRVKGFSSYFLVVEDIVRRCPRTCGRGSSASSIVSYLLGITHVEPLSHNLFFERFLNMGRKDPPDIDEDFPWDEREKALAYVFGTYRGRAGMVADHVTFGPRSSLREPARAAGLTEEETGRLIKLVRTGETDRIPRYLITAAERLRGMPRHLGSHPGGVVITPGPITDYTHLEPADTGFPVIAWEKDATEEAGLVKIDLLGNRSLGVLRDALNLINRDAPRQILWEGFSPLQDVKTRELIEKGDTLGVFYVESPATRQLLTKMGRGDFGHLVIASSIIRPAANRFITEFVRRLRGGAWDPVHPLVEETLRETLGIMVYQEDVARVSIAMAGFAPEEADGLRKALSKKDREIRLKCYRGRFFEGGRERGVTEEVLEKLWDMILSFDGYSFCKAHSASYALVSYKLAWVKRYYPLEFFTSVINNHGGFYTEQVYLNAVRRLGFRILGPDVNRSGLRHSLETLPSGEKALRLGLSQLKEVHGDIVSALIGDRQKRGDYADMADFTRRLDPPPSCMRIFIRSGSLDGISGGLSRPQMFWALFYLRERGTLLQDSFPRRADVQLQERRGYLKTCSAAAGRPPPQAVLFDFPPVPAVADYPSRVKLLDEVRTLGAVISVHPLSVLLPRVKGILGRLNLPECIDSRNLRHCLGRRVCIPGLYIAGKEVSTRKKQYMSFVSFEDPFGLFETVLFPDSYERLAAVLEYGAGFLVQGRVQEEFGAYTLEVDNLIRLNR